jgi:hypothetical protein
MRTILALCFCSLLVACAAANQQTTAPPPPITCTNKNDCDAKWSRAVSWIASNSSWKIQTQTDFLIQTYNSINDSAAPSFTITKVAQPNGTFQITFDGGCANIFGCVPTVAESRARFAEFVKRLDFAERTYSQAMNSLWNRMKLSG